MPDHIYVFVNIKFMHLEACTVGSTAKMLKIDCSVDASTNHLSCSLSRPSPGILLIEGPSTIQEAGHYVTDLQQILKDVCDDHHATTDQGVQKPSYTAIDGLAIRWDKAWEAGSQELKMLWDQLDNDFLMDQLVGSARRGTRDVLELSYHTLFAESGLQASIF